jgi:phage shock protein PspC (stress-responsive transcriptional regulator)
MADETTSDQTPELPHQVPELPDPTVPGTGPTADDPPTGAAPDDNPTDPTPDRAPDRAPAKLRRDTEHRLLGGVAAGVARYLDVDVVFVRVAFAVLTVLGGSGALIYLAAWLLIPADDEEHPLVQQWAGRRPPRRSLVVIVVGVVLGLIALSDLFSNGPWRPHPYGGFGVVLGALALVVALSLVAGSGGNRTAGSRLRWLLSDAGPGWRGGRGGGGSHRLLHRSGQRGAAARRHRGHPGPSHHHWPAGLQLPVGHGQSHRGPDRCPVQGRDHQDHDVGGHRTTCRRGSPRAHRERRGPQRLGDVQVFGQDNSGFSTVQTMEAGGTGRGARRHIVVTADTGVGQVQVVRMAPAFS